ncbi:helicase-exonuclease AddAB subunit AddA [Butyrivibrio sp. JL13D10]|uniref:helicase-exonuclease AddAB subunit AddA n=1 Tax=Butyrivibrio sp. JL13D10 TaxID=3236815 RepID=UPI0038B632D6
MGFTTEQQAVIDARNSNVLVSAAAGSGKTTVLVERIIQRITGENPIDIDKLLVVTFTKAAAASMKEKILAAIQKKLAENPDDKHLQRQETLVHGAQITTIDSFCQYIIRNNFNDIGLDPSYRVGDEGEMRLLQADVMEELLEDRYTEGNGDFLNCMEYFATGSRDEGVEEYILSLYKYAMSMPFPEKWLSERAEDYSVKEEDFEAEPFVKMSKRLIKNKIAESIQNLSMALAISNEPDGPYMYADLLEIELEQAQKLVAATEEKSFDEIRASIINANFARLSGKKDDSVNKDKREQAKNYRNQAKNVIEDLQNNYFAEDKKTICEHMEFAKKPVQILAGLAKSFKERFDEKKREKGIIDFGDMEHLALQIILNGGAKQYRDFFEEVMIDEYQDSNDVQECLLSAISGESEAVYNRFMVGDVKQSIYKFRLAKPEIFMDKMEKYSWDDGDSQRKISLHNNFRSRSQVLDSVNFVFEQVMGEDLGKVSYDEDARLVTGGSFTDSGADDENFATELLLVNTKGAASDEAREIEARAIALRIRELMENGIVSGDNGELRKVRYGDIVILLRTNKGWDETFRKVLASRGIPAYVESRTGYFSATEVVTVLNFLRILDNPRQDVALVGVMHSAIGEFTDEELALIKAYDKHMDNERLDSGSFYDILTRVVSTDVEALKEGVVIPDDLLNKIKDFVDLIDEYRIKAEYLPVNELIRDILDETHYGEYCASMPGGTKRLANLNMLKEKAADYEKTSFSGVFHFVRYIEQLEKFEVDYGEANVLDENADVVRIMSIHKSKGLEFPIVFLSGMAKKFNYMDVNKSVVLDVDFGIGTFAIDLQKRIKYKNLRKTIMGESMKMDILGEEMRILYVAMTRAKDKLIMTGQTKLNEGDKPKSGELGTELLKYSSYRNIKGNEEKQPYLLPFYLRNGADCYQDLILMALSRHPVYEELCNAGGVSCDQLKEERKLTPFVFRIISPEELTAEEIGSEVTSEIRLKRLLTGDIDSDISVDASVMNMFDDRFSDTYAFKAFDKLFVKTTVTELKRAQLEQKDEPAHVIYDEEEIVPAFVGKKEQKAQGAARGTIYHRVMELLYESDKITPDSKINRLPEWIKEMESEGRIPDNASETVNPADVRKFYDSDAGKRMRAAYDNGGLHRESPFMMGISANKINEEFPESELVLIQGIIDVWFEEGEDIVLLDYKTDKVKEGRELAEKYKIQLDYYQEALERITKKKVKERIIYSFTLGETISV